MIYFELKEFLKNKNFYSKRFIKYLENLYEKSIYNFCKDNLENLKKNWNKIVNIYTNYPNDYPIEYITKKTYFFGYKFFINSKVLIPRKDTECLVEEAIKITKKFFKTEKNLKVLDLCTGSGCVGISYYKYITKFQKKEIELILSDISLEALKITKINLFYHNIRAYLILQDKVNALKEKKFNIVLSNPPYIEPNSPFISKSIKYEPKISLFANLDFLRQLAYEVKKILKESGVYIFECAPYQIKSLKSYLNKIYKDVDIYFDYNKLPRGFICKN